MCPVGVVGLRVQHMVISLFLILLDIFLGVLDQTIVGIGL
jgi:hypothetical protein